MNRTLLLTGGSGKFGKVFLRHFAKKGWNIVATSRDKKRIDGLISSLGDIAGTVVGVSVDFSEPGSVDYLIDEVAKHGLSVSHLVNNARSIEALAVSEEGQTQHENFMREFEIDVVVPYELAIKLSQPSSHSLKNIVNIGSMYGLVAPNPALYEGTLKNSPVQYGVSKAALHQLTRELAVRLAPNNIRVNCVAYGGVEGRVDEAFLGRYAALVPSRRMLSEDEIVGPVDFLLNDSSSGVNGHVLVVDGGWTIW
jgi:NAD(P)-dependent dehydrogenase (short-subunit alcohol dehydrogenase family)